MSLDTLTTPHPYIAADRAIQPEPFSMAAGITEARDYLATAPDYEAAKLEVVEHMVGTVSQTLRCHDKPAREDQRELTTFDTLDAEQVTNCMGYATVLSESLEAVGIEHYICYAYNHFMVAVPTVVDGRLRLRSYDALFGSMNQDLTDMLSKGNAETMLRDLRSGQPRSSAMLDLGELAKASGVGSDPTGRDNWLTGLPGKGQLTDGHTMEHERKLYNTNCTAVLSLFQPGPGRDMLRQYAEYKVGGLHGDTRRASGAILRMSGLYPEIDVRVEDQLVEKLVRRLCADRQFETATAVVDSYMSSFSISAEPRVDGMRGDLLRIIATQGSCPDTAEKMESAYTSAADAALKVKHKLLREMYAGKALKARRIRERMGRQTVARAANMATM